MLTNYQYFTSSYAATLQDDGVEYHKGPEEVEINWKNPGLKFVADIMAPQGVASLTQDANINTSVSRVVRADMERRPVESENREDMLGLKLKYLRQNLWSLEAESKMIASVWTETAEPLPRPPACEYENLPVFRSLTDRPDLFRVVSPIRIEAFERFLETHPNKVFVASVVAGLHHGFWPWATTVREDYPTTHDESKPMVLSEEKELFLRSQLIHEQSLGRVSAEVREALIPGMYCMPCYVVPKPQHSGWHLMNDSSAGNFSLNSMVDRQYVTGYPLDNLAHLGELLLRKYQRGDRQQVVWKSDIAEAYRMCPMHPMWQIKQGVRILGKLYVDRVNQFGGCASPAIFIAVNVLVAWIA